MTDAREAAAEVWHAVTCPFHRRWLRHRWHMPFWRDDKTAQMLGVAEYGCPRCGRGATRQRDAAEQPAADHWHYAQRAICGRPEHDRPGWRCVLSPLHDGPHDPLGLSVTPAQRLEAFRRNRQEDQ